MTSAYWDSSGVVKLLIEESGWEIAVETWNGAERNIASRLVVPEVSAALAAARRGARLDEESDRDARLRWARYQRAIEFVELTPAVGAHAANLAVEHDLSGADAVHLASALMLRQAELIVLTWDRRLSDATVDAGLRVVPDGF